MNLLRHPLAKPLVHLLCLAPFAWGVWLAVSGGLGANPIEAGIRYLGDWALRLLLITLALSPLRGITGWSALGSFRRMLGLYAFSYAVLHFSVYAGIDQFFDFRAIWADFVKRTYITFGLAALLVMVPLAVTSTNAMARRLGGRRWKRLHLLVHVAAGAAVVHYYMMVKADIRQPLAYGAILVALWAWRIVARRPRDGGGRAAAAARAQPSR